MSIQGIEKQLSEMSELEKGWLYGKGEQFDREQLLRLAALFRNSYTHENEPWLYPMLDAQVLAEWKSGDWRISMEIELSQMKGDVLAANIADGRTFTLELDLGSSESWRTLCNLLDRPDTYADRK